MKTVEMVRDFDYHAHPRRTVRFQAGIIYTRVIERAAQAIEDAGAGRIVPSNTVGNYLLMRDASDAWTRHRRR